MAAGAPRSDPGARIELVGKGREDSRAVRVERDEILQAHAVAARRRIVEARLESQDVAGLELALVAGAAPEARVFVQLVADTMAEPVHVTLERAGVRDRRRVAAA